METEYITEFIKIAELKSFSLAAEELLISQSSLSKHIKTLETQLGAQLFDRTTRSVMLTPFGQNILVLCETITDYSQEIMKLADNQLTKNRNHLMITSIPVMAQYNITGFIAGFLKSNVDFHISFTESESYLINNLLRNGNYELAFTRIVNKEDPNFESIPFYTDTLVATLPKNHRLASRKSLRIKELINENFIFLDENTLLYDHLNELCRKHGFMPKVIQTSHRLETIIDLVSKEFGITLLYRRQADFSNNPKLVSIDIDPPSTSVISLTRFKGHKLSYAANAFWEYLKDRNA